MINNNDKKLKKLKIRLNVFVNINTHIVGYLFTLIAFVQRIQQFWNLTHSFIHSNDNNKTKVLYTKKNIFYFNLNLLFWKNLI